ncbi:MAG: hypothetical protein Q8L85_07065 [Alphaproteobacteria bacterium]|nr:hypothetical protein [Alphaproteobacteria bacterium]
MRIVLSLFCFVFTTSFLYGKNALVTYFGAEETQIALQDWETGKIKQKFGFKLDTLKAFYHTPSQKLIFFAPNRTEFSIYTANANTFLKSNIGMDVEFVSYLAQKDIFIAQDNKTFQLILLRLSTEPTPQFTIIDQIPFQEKLISSFNAENNKFYFLTSKKLYLIDFEKNNTLHEVYMFNDYSFNKIIAVLLDNTIFLQANNYYVHFDLTSKKVKDLKKGFLVLSETPDIVFMSHRGDQDKNVIINKKTRNLRQNAVKNPAEKIIFTPDSKNVYFLTRKSVKLYQFNENKLIHKFSFGKNAGQINLFFID